MSQNRFLHNIYASFEILHVYDNISVVLCKISIKKGQSGYGYFARLEFKMSFGGISYIATVPN